MNFSLFKLRKCLSIKNVKLNIRSYSSISTQTTFEDDFERNQIQINWFQKTLLTIGAAAQSIMDPHRGDMIACLGETTGENAANYIMEQMKLSKEGCEILLEKPRINSRVVDMNYLKKLPEGTLGKTYVDFLKKHKITPDSRLPVQFVSDPQLAYILQRYREVHDLIHTVLQMQTNMLGEVTVKWVEAIQTKLPMCIGGAIFGPIRLKPKHRQLYLKYYLPWAIKTANESEFLLSIYYEKRWEQPLEEFYKDMNIKPLIYK